MWSRNVAASRRYFSCGVKLPECGFVPKKYTGMSVEKLKSTRGTRVHPSLQAFYKEPVVLHQGHKQWLFDVNGKRYLDMFGGICTVSVGHCHPKINEAVKEQMATLNHVSNVYYHSKIHEYAERLTDKLPGELKVAFFVNSGSEANDLAILMARAYTSRSDIITLRNCYHGMTNHVMSATATGSYKHAVAQSPGFHHVMNPDVYKGIWGGIECRTEGPCSCGPVCTAREKYIEQFNEIFKYSLNKRNLAGFIAEPIQGVGGIVQYPAGYLKNVNEIVKESGGLYISDEVQTGFGRTGKHFWGFEGHGVTPDIVTMAKGIGNGYPLGAVVTTLEVARALAKNAFFNTFGGNPIACTVGLSVLDIIQEEKLQENCQTTGGYLFSELGKLKGEFEVIGDVRGAGLMLGIEMTNGRSKAPLEKSRFDELFELTKDMGLLVGRGGADANVIRIQPPMCIARQDADFTVNVLRDAIKKIA